MKYSFEKDLVAYLKERDRCFGRYERFDVSLDTKIVLFFEKAAEDMTKKLNREVVAGDIISLLLEQFMRDEKERDRLVAMVPGK